MLALRHLLSEEFVSERGAIVSSCADPALAETLAGGHFGGRAAARLPLCGTFGSHRFRPRTDRLDGRPGRTGCTGRAAARLAGAGAQLDRGPGDGRSALDGGDALSLDPPADLAGLPGLCAGLEAATRAWLAPLRRSLGPEEAPLIASMAELLAALGWPEDEPLLEGAERLFYLKWRLAEALARLVRQLDRNAAHRGLPPVPLPAGCDPGSLSAALLPRLARAG